MNRPLATSALALILGAGPALADVTPAEVWQSLQDSYEQMGYAVQVGSEDASDEAITLTDVVLTVDGEADAPDMVLTLPEIVLTAVGNGTVRSVVGGQMTLESSAVPEGDDEAVGFSMTMDAPGNETISSGTPEALTHDVTMPTLTMSGRALDDRNEVPLTATLTGVTGSQTITTAADGASTQTFEGRADALEAQITASGPSLAATDAPETETAPDATDAPEASEAPDAPAATAEADDFQATITIADLTMQGDGTSPAGEVNFGSQPTQALQAGFGGKGSFAMGATSGSFTASTLTADGSRNDSEGSFQAASGTLAVGMSKDGLSYEGADRHDDQPDRHGHALPDRLWRGGEPVPAGHADRGI